MSIAQRGVKKTEASVAAEDDSVVLEVRGLCKTFHTHGSSHEVLRDVDMTVRRGRCLAIVGESGSGKTTAARIIAGLETASAGSVSLPSRQRLAKNAHPVQMVFQDPYGSLDPRQTIGNGIRELLDLHKGTPRGERRERVKTLLSEVGLDERHASLRPTDLSGGQRQRVAISRALALEPELLILDEAVSALDVSVQAQVLNLLSDIRERVGISYLFVSHDLGVVRQASDDCIVLSKGRVVEAGPTGSVLDDPKDPYTQALLRAVPRPGWTPSRRTV
ncbi:ABC transporter ATP-binding protein [Rhodococcoides kroppenstedtii]|uniref:ABC transporter ATP-binding protein n=1 Tax=Rhodococcoides kroppenstedtii TaxID=293050 RepID=UPI0028E194D5|nr:ATP-binding cassette domain-containing protein [Rhodococcus kroppenstedtii]